MFTGDGFCNFERFVSPDDRGTYNWAETAVETPPIVRELECFYEPQQDIGVARRACRTNNTWSHPDDSLLQYDGSQCVTNSTYQLRLLSQVSSYQDSDFIVIPTYLLMQQEITAENFEMVGTAVVNIVSGLDEEDEQSEGNLDIIANVYENITELVQSGQIMVTKTVSITCSNNIILKHNYYIVCKNYCKCCEWHI